MNASKNKTALRHCLLGFRHTVDAIVPCVPRGQITTGLWHLILISQYRHADLRGYTRIDGVPSAFSILL